MARDPGQRRRRATEAIDGDEGGMSETRETLAGEGGRDHFTDFDIDSPELNEEYEQVLDSLVQECPVARSRVGSGYWVVSKYDDVRSVAQDWETFTSTKGFIPDKPEGMPFIYPVELDPPYQSRWRTALAPYFSPRAVRAHEEAIVREINDLIDGFAASGECDVVTDLAGPLPGRVFLSCFLGVPLSELSELQGIFQEALFGPIEERPAQWGKAADYMDNYLRKREAEEPRGDLVDAILAGVEDEDGSPCGFDHKVSVLNDFVAGGLGTTTYLLACMIMYLATHPEDRARLAADPSLQTHAVEEMVRVYNPIVGMGRSATKDVKIRDQQLHKGDFVMLSFAAACRDPQYASNPSVIDIDRELPVNAAFGFGPHRCPGLHLARLEATLVMREFLKRIPDFEIAPGQEAKFSTAFVRSMDNLPIVFAPVNTAP
jgi:cytochrome P450